MSINRQAGHGTVNIRELGYQRIPVFPILMLTYSVLEGKDRGSLFTGLIIGVGYVIAYVFVARLYKRFVERAWSWLSARCHGLVMQLILDAAVTVFDLMLLYFPFLFLIWRTNILCAPVLNA